MGTEPFVYCPRCGTRLSQQERLGDIRPACPACDFVQYWDPKVAVIALVRDGGRVLLIQRAVDPARGKWALPGGFMDAGEMPEEALKRELLEEVGLEIEVKHLIDIFPMFATAKRSPGIVLAYAATPQGTTAAPTLRSNDDVSDAGWFSADALPTEIAFASTHELLAHWQAHPWE